MAKEKVVDAHVAGVDIGTSHVRVVIARPADGGGINIVGIGKAASKGLRKGVVVNLDATVESIKAAVEEAELMAGFPIDAAFVGVAGTHVKGLDSRGVVAIPHADLRVRSEDVVRVLDAAKAIQIPRDREILHAVPQEYTVDEQSDVADPVGMTGSRLEADVHVITVGAQSTQNLITCVNRAGISVRSMVLETLASAQCTLTDDEKELGVALIDIGGGTSDIAVFEKGAIRHVATIQVGGDHFTNDIAVGLRTPVPDAERIKRKHGAALASLVGEEEVIEVASVGGRRPRLLSLQILSEIIQPRAEEIYGLLKAEIDKAGYSKSLNSGVVLVGGASLMPGMVEVAEQLFELPVRLGVPKGIGCMTDAVSTPSFTVAVGLAAWGNVHGGPNVTKVEEPSFSLGRMPGKVAGWFSDILAPVSSAASGRRAAR
jgi:cell division protein FtsA